VIAMPVADEVSNTPLIANARMYSSGAPAAGAAWTSLFVTRAPIGPDLVGKLQAAFMSTARADELKAERDMLLIADFVIPEQAPYQALRARAEAAAIYPDVW
jgi:hypothetical protein